MSLCNLLCFSLEICFLRIFSHVIKFSSVTFNLFSFLSFPLGHQGPARPNLKALLALLVIEQYDQVIRAEGGRWGAGKIQRENEESSA